MVLLNFGTLGCSSLQSRRRAESSNPQRIERVSQIATAVVVILQTSAVKSGRFADGRSQTMVNDDSGSGGTDLVSAADKGGRNAAAIAATRDHERDLRCVQWPIGDRGSEFSGSART
jgi:hypothetical protein